MCLACCVSEWVHLFLDTVGMVHLYLDESLFLVIVGMVCLCLDKTLCMHLSKSS